MEKIGDILPLLVRGYSFGLRDKHIQDLIGISAGTMSRAKTDTERLGAQDWLDCKNLILDCEELVRRNPLPINWTDLRAVRRELEALRSERKNPPAEPTEEDLDIFRRFVGGELLDEIALRHQMEKADVLRRIEQINSRAQHLSRKATVDRQ